MRILINSKGAAPATLALLLCFAGAPSALHGATWRRTGDGGGLKVAAYEMASDDVDAVRKPAAWSLMIAGVGALGGAFRRAMKTLN